MANSKLDVRQEDSPPKKKPDTPVSVPIGRGEVVL